MQRGQNEHSMTHKKRRAPEKKGASIQKGVLVAVLCILAASLAGVLLALGGNKTVHITLQDEKLPQEVFDQVMAQQVFDVTYQYTQLGMDTNDPEFWTTQQEGVTPGEALMKATVQQLRTLTAMYELAQETGTPLEGGLAGILGRMEGENQSRKEKIAAGQPVYGLSQFTFQTFLEYEMDWMKKQYCGAPENPKMEVTDADRQAFYRQNRDTDFILPDGITFGYVYMNTSTMDAQQVQQLTEQVRQLEEAVEQGRSLKEAVEEYPDLTAWFVYLDLEPEQVGSYNDSIGDVLDLAYQLEPGEHSGVVENNGGVYLVQCVARTHGVYLPLEDVTDSIDQTLRQQRYDALVESRGEGVQLTVNEQEMLAYIVDKMTRKG